MCPKGLKSDMTSLRVASKATLRTTSLVLCFSGVPVCFLALPALLPLRMLSCKASLCLSSMLPCTPHVIGQFTVPYLALLTPSVLIQKHHPYTGSLNSKPSVDSRNVFLHCGGVLGVMRGANRRCRGVCIHSVLRACVRRYRAAIKTSMLSIKVCTTCRMLRFM